MSFEQDAAAIRDVMQGGDPAFDAVAPAVKASALRAVDLALTQTRDAFLLAGMRAIATAGNGHSRVIPNAAISVLPARIVVRDGRLAMVVGAQAHAVVSVNGVAAEALVEIFAPWLAGTPVRRLKLSGIMLVWPAALALAGVTGPRFHYVLETAPSVELHAAEQVAALPLYQISDTGAVLPTSDPFALPQGAVVARQAGVSCVRIADLKALSPAQVEESVAQLAAHPTDGVVIDLRGNPGGDFTTAMPLVWWLRDVWTGARCAVLVNGDTFSAAIVVAALLSFHLKGRVAFFGSEMGDDLAFWAEGDTVLLPQSGAHLRFSSAWHNWRDGQVSTGSGEDWVQWVIAAGDVDIQTVALHDQMPAALGYASGS